MNKFLTEVEMSGKQAGRIACKACIGIRYTVRAYRVSNQLVNHRKRSSRPINKGVVKISLYPLGVILSSKEKAARVPLNKGVVKMTVPSGGDTIFEKTILLEIITK